MTEYIPVGTTLVRADAILAIAEDGHGGSAVYLSGTVFSSPLPPTDLIAKVEQALA